MVLKVYTDGACSGNPGPGGWGGILCLPKEIKKISGFENSTTNNRMELMAVLKVIENVLNMIYQEENGIEKLEIFSDSAYVINALKKGWLKKWFACGFKTSEGNDVKNVDLWKRMNELLETSEFIGLEIDFVKVKGHSGNYFNEQVDMLAKQAINGGLLN